MKRRSCKLNVLALAVLFAVASGCVTADKHPGRDAELYTAAYTYEEPSYQGNTISSDEFIEYAARIQFIHQKFQDRFSAAIEASDLEEARRVQGEFHAAADNLRAELGITSRQIDEFEIQNPGFLQEPENKHRIIERIQALSE